VVEPVKGFENVIGLYCMSVIYVVVPFGLNEYVEFLQRVHVSAFDVKWIGVIMEWIGPNEWWRFSKCSAKFDLFWPRE
jgi:hypothetical protein